jgi:exodeoxyribonuclease-3
VTRGLGLPDYDREGRLLALEFPAYYFVTLYSPNSQHGLLRLDYRMAWEDALKNFLLTLNKPVIFCGDFNVAHREIDLKNPKTNVNNPGFTPHEREKMTALLDAGFVDTFRHLYPDKRDAYTWWSFRSDARKNNTGWRIDYFLVSECLKDSIKEAFIYNEVLGSDHCPVGLQMEML